MSDFELHPNLAKKIFIADLPLCRVLLQDESQFPWIFLVPRLPNINRIMDLSEYDQLDLMRELDGAQKIMMKQFKPTQLNVAAIGNKIPQLHIHVIARYENDPAWPQTVWDHPTRSSYTPEKKEQVIRDLKREFEECSELLLEELPF